MPNVRPNQVKRLFDAAYALDAEHQQAFLDALDPALRKDVEHGGDGENGEKCRRKIISGNEREDAKNPGSSDAEATGLRPATRAV